MVGVMTKSQALQAAWQRDFLLALVEVLPKCQALKVTREQHTIQALVEALAKCQSSKTSWPIHMLQPLVKETTVATKESQVLKLAWQRLSGKGAPFNLLGQSPRNVIRVRQGGAVQILSVQTSLIFVTPSSANS
jgi:hypothetical protein